MALFELKNKNMNNKISLLEKLKWYDINHEGHIDIICPNESAIYIYRKISNPLEYYIGSSIRIKDRTRCHKYFIFREDYKSKGSPLFYRSVRKYGWMDFQFGILENIKFLDIHSIEDKKRLILEREQYYLDLLEPTFNINKIAGSPLGLKRSLEFSINSSKSKRGVKHNYKVTTNNIGRSLTEDIKSKISVRCKGISVKIYNKNNKEFIKEFPTLSKAASYLGVHRKTISNIYARGVSYDDYIYEFKVKDTRIWVYDSSYNIIDILKNGKETSINLNIPVSTLSEYVRSGKLYNNKYYFHNSINNIFKGK